MRLSLIDRLRSADFHPAPPADRLRPLLRLGERAARAPRMGLDVRSLRNCRGSGCHRGSILATGSSFDLAHTRPHADGDDEATDRREPRRVARLETLYEDAREGGATSRGSPTKVSH